MIDFVRIVRRNMDGGHSLEAVKQIPGIVAVDIPEAYIILLFLASPAVIYTEASFTVGIDNIRIAGFRNSRPSLTASVRLPEGSVSSRYTSGRKAGNRNGRIILLSRVKPIRKIIADVHLVELSSGLIVLRGPGFTPIKSHVGSSVIGLNENVRIVRIDPHVMVVSVRNRLRLPGLSGIR
jgi:hypothetical protein